MIEQKPVQTINADKASYFRAMGLFSLDMSPGGNTGTVSMITDDNIFIDHWISRYSQALHRAEALYRSIRFAGFISRLLSWLFHQPVQLKEASEIVPDMNTLPHFSGLKPVSISRIIASETSFNDFDVAFNPLNDKNRTRWINLATAVLLGAESPPVDLLQVDNTYIVRDGHQRISVVRALGRESIIAYVTKLPDPSRATLSNRSI